MIPRPETEELVALCLEQTEPAENLRVVDIGTGTGAIAVSLKLARPHWQIAAVDLSEAALAVAKENAAQLGVEVAFYQGDTLTPVGDQSWDIIVSNPPYISEQEWELMDASVRQFEPQMALFAAENGLVMYRKIADQAKKLLTPDGKIFVEIGFQQGKSVQRIFAEAFPDKKVTVIQDLSGKDRLVAVQ